MVDTKSTEQTRKKWEGAIPRVAASYADGIANTKDFIAKAVAGEDNYGAGVQAAVASRRRARKLQELSDEQWKAAARDKGAARIGPGMIAAKEKFGTGIAKVLDTIRGVTIAPRTTDGIANVDGRVKPIVAALMKMKE